MWGSLEQEADLASPMAQRGKDDPIVLRDADKNDIQFKAPRSIQTESAKVNRKRLK